MAIKWTWKRLPVDENGRAYDSLEDFQSAELQKMESSVITPDVGRIIVSEKEKVMEILSITADSRPRARGVPKPRKNKTKAAPEPELPVKAA